jgi:hypothetical protein
MKFNFLLSILTLGLLFTLGCTCMKVPNYVPMPQGYWSNNPLGGIWIIRYWTTDNQVPPCDMWATVTHADMTGVGLIMQGSGQLIGCQGDSYAYDFPSHQPLQDLVEYMDLHPGIFFDHSEFVGADPGKYILPVGTDEYFEFTIRDPHDSDNYFCIAKGIVPGQPVAPEIQYVIDELTVWKNEILLHPQ